MRRKIQRILDQEINPSVATHGGKIELVDYANEKGSIIVFDAAYAPFIRSADVPKSIFEIEGARTCAIASSAPIPRWMIAYAQQMTDERFWPQLQ